MWKDCQWLGIIHLYHAIEISHQNKYFVSAINAKSHSNLFKRTVYRFGEKGQNQKSLDGMEFFSLFGFLDILHVKQTWI